MRIQLFRTETELLQHHVHRQLDPLLVCVPSVGPGYWPSVVQTCGSAAPT